MAVIVTFDITLLLLFLFPLTDGYVFMLCCLKQRYFIATGPFPLIYLIENQC